MTTTKRDYSEIINSKHNKYAKKNGKNKDISHKNYIVLKHVSLPIYQSTSIH